MLSFSDILFRWRALTETIQMMVVVRVVQVRLIDVIFMNCTF